MRKKTITITLSAFVLILLGINLQMASAHRWWKWHWNKSTVRYYNFATRNAEAQAAINDWNACSGFTLSKRTSHTDISVFDGNYGATGWWGLAEIKNSGWDWWCWWWCAIKHGHARFNIYYGGRGGIDSNSDIRGVQCQEVGHLFGLGHSNNGCMGKGYYNNSNVVDRSHSCRDVRNYTH